MTPDPYFFIVIFCGVALVFPLVPLALAWMWRRFFQPPKAGPGQKRDLRMRGGIDGEARVQFQSHYYLYCIIFLIFDVEAIFLVPFAVAFTSLPHGRVHRDPGFPAAAGRRAGLGVEQGLLLRRLGAKSTIEPGTRWTKGFGANSRSRGFSRRPRSFTTGAEATPSGRCNSVWPVAPSR